MTLLERHESCKFKLRDTESYQEGTLVTSFEDGYEQKVILSENRDMEAPISNIIDLQVFPLLYSNLFLCGENKEDKVIYTHAFHNKIDYPEPPQDYLLPQTGGPTTKIRGWLLSSGTLQINPSKVWPKATLSIFKTDENAYAISLCRVKNDVGSCQVYRVRNTDEMLRVLIWITNSFREFGDRIRKRFSRFSDKLFWSFLHEEEARGLLIRDNELFNLAIPISMAHIAIEKLSELKAEFETSHPDERVEKEAAALAC